MINKIHSIKISHMLFLIFSLTYKISNTNTFIPLHNSHSHWLRRDPNGHLVRKWRRINVDTTWSRRINVNKTSILYQMPAGDSSVEKKQTIRTLSKMLNMPAQLSARIALPQELLQCKPSYISELWPLWIWIFQQMYISCCNSCQSYQSYNIYKLIYYPSISGHLNITVSLFTIPQWPHKLGHKCMHRQCRPRLDKGLHYLSYHPYVFARTIVFWKLSMNCRDFSVKWKLIISLFPTLKYHCRIWRSHT